MVDPAKFSDLSCPPIGDTIKYERGDGKQMELIMNKQQHAKGRATVRLPPGVPIAVNPKAGINLGALKKPATHPATIAYSIPPNITDHPSFDAKVTIFILLYGDFYDLHKRCIQSLLQTVPANRMDLRIGSNMICQQSRDLVDAYVKTGVVTKHYYHAGNDYKYPVMREMFWDESHPITTKWILWFDDDSICSANQDWFNILATHIAQHHKDKQAHMIGSTHIWTANKRQREIMESRPWYKRRPWRDKAGQPSPNGSKIIFAVGGFWALTTEAMRAADIPDLGTGLQHNGGDWQIGEQLYQAGYGLKQFNSQKQFVHTSSVARRGAVTPTMDQVVQPVVLAPVTELPPSNSIAMQQASLQVNDAPVALKGIVRL